MKAAFKKVLLLGSIMLCVTLFVVCSNTSVRAQDLEDTSSVSLKPDPNAVATGDASDTDEAPPKTQEHFTVTTWKIQKKKPEGAKPIQLMLPTHNSKFTPGVVTFSWKLSPTVKKKKVQFVLEKIDTKKKAIQYWKGEKLSIDLKSGKYRWQIVSGSPKVESHWRAFTVIDMKSNSLTKLYDGPTPGKKTVARAKKPTVEKPVSDSEVAAAAPTHDPSVYDVDEAANDEQLKEWKDQKLKAEQQAKDLENQLEVAKQEHYHALQAAKEQAGRLKAERQTKLKLQKLAEERALKEAAQRKAQAKAERESKARYAKLRAKQMEEMRFAKLKAEKSMKKLQARIEAEKRAKLEVEQATRDLVVKVDAEKQAAARLKIKTQEMDDEESGQEPAPVAAKTFRPKAKPEEQAQVPAQRRITNPAVDAGPPSEPPPVPGGASDPGNAANVAPPGPPPAPAIPARAKPITAAPRTPAQQTRAPSSVAPAPAPNLNSDAPVPPSTKKSDADSLQW